MKRSCGFIGLALIISLISAIAAYAALTGNIRGVISDVEGNTIKGIKVTVTSLNLQGERIAYSYEDGEYFFFDLPPGIYNLKAELAGLQTKEFTGIAVQVNQTIKYDFVMELETQVGTLTVTAEAPVIDTSSSTIATIINREFTERLPGADDGYQSAMSIPPGAVQGGDGNPNVHGGSKMDNSYLFDGINTTDPLTNTFGSNLGPDVVQEIEVQTGGFKAEYGHAMGGIVNVITKSGGNDYSGTFRFNIVNNKWTAKNKHDDVPAFIGSDYEDYNGTFGGPIIKDKLWFFGSFGITPITVKKTLLINEYLSDGQIATQGISADRDFMDYFGKVTYQQSEKNKFVFEIFGDPATIHFDEDVNYSPSAQSRQEQGGTSFNIHWTYISSPELFFDTRFSGSLAYLDNYPDDKNASDISYYNRTKDVWYGNYFRWSETNRDRYGFDFATTYFKPNYHGEHKFKFGAEYQRLQLEDYYNFTGNGVYFETEEDENGTEIPYRKHVKKNVERTKDVGNLYAFFAQDDWEVAKGLTLNLGVRYDYAVYENDAGKQSGKFDSMLAPRIGASYDIKQDGKSKIYGNYARYYNTLDLQIPGAVNEKNAIDETWRYDPSNPDADSDGYVLENVSGDPEFPNVMDKDLKPEYTDEFVIGAEQMVARNTSIGLRGIYKRTRNIIEDAGVYWDENGHQISDPYGPDLYNYSYIVTNPDDARKNYYAIELTLRRKTENLTIETSYTYARSKGTVIGTQPQSYGGVTHFSIDYDMPLTSKNLYGPLPWDAPHYFKVFASYHLPWYDIFLSPSFFARSGYAYTKFGEDPIYGKGSTYPEGRGTYRLPSIFVMDLSVQKDFKFGKYGILTLIGEISNLTNGQKVIDVGQNEGNYFGSVRDRVNPTVFTLGMKYEF